MQPEEFVVFQTHARVGKIDFKRLFTEKGLIQEIGDKKKAKKYHKYDAFSVCLTPSLTSHIKHKGELLQRFRFPSQSTARCSGEINYKN